MTPEAFRLFRTLACGRPLSAMDCAKEIGISRAGVSKHVQQLRDCGLPVASLSGERYRLGWPIRMLDADEIRRASGADITVDVVGQTASTNSDLAEDFSHRHLLAAEYQADGRGRRGRGWISPPGCGVCCSFGYRFDLGLPRLAALSLVAGVAAAEVVSGEGVPVTLKWPNDLVIGRAKLGGVLVEIRGPSEGPCEVVAGIGINSRLPRGNAGSSRFIEPDQRWTDLHASAPDCLDPGCDQGIDRSRIIGRLGGALDMAFAQFKRDGFEPFVPRWRALDALDGCDVRVSFADGRIFDGVAAGVDGRGQLRIAGENGIRVVNAGEVSIRAK